MFFIFKGIHKFDDRIILCDNINRILNQFPIIHNINNNNPQNITSQNEGEGNI